MVLSVPAFPGPLYYRGPVLLHPDHLMHVFAGGLVTWLCLGLFSSGGGRGRLSHTTVVALAVVLAMGLGAAKEVTDWRSVVSSGHHYNQMDTVRDMGSNAIGVGGVMLWRGRRGRDPQDESGVVFPTG